jgi:hypothetical protein
MMFAELTVRSFDGIREAGATSDDQSISQPHPNRDGEDTVSTDRILVGKGEERRAY